MLYSMNLLSVMYSVNRFMVIARCSRQLIIRAEYSNVRKFHQNVRDPSFKELYPEVIHDLRVDHGLIAEVNSHLEEILRHNVLCRNFYAVLPVLTVYRLVSPKEHQTSDNLRLANILDWCTEIATGAYSMSDDMLDGSETRWNQKCWYRTDMGKAAVNDIQLMQIAVYKLLHANFIDKPYYNNLTHLFTNAFYNSYVGEMFDNNTNRMFQKNRDISAFTMSKFRVCADYKINHFGYTCPVYAAMMLADVPPKKLTQCIDRVLQGLSYLVQIQNDTMDCYGDTVKYGKECTDIREGKLTWVIVKALEDANKKQTEILATNYGKDDDKCIKTVQNVYDELRILDKYKVHNQEVIDDVQNNINSIPDEAIRKVLQLCLDTHVGIDRLILE
ncbi:hypothetical protein RI129_011020 [Pyrocoelia pectoralis]|uniref:Farnesyl pyrophosphate synthase n=1 Tax=Pyrocoelia pectoralis TaxID=417401 RepID=A0AAN7V5G9_9COLE